MNQRFALMVFSVVPPKNTTLVEIPLNIKLLLHVTKFPKFWRIRFAHCYGHTVAYTD